MKPGLTFYKLVYNTLKVDLVKLDTRNKPTNSQAIWLSHFHNGILETLHSWIREFWFNLRADAHSF